MNLDRIEVKNHRSIKEQWGDDAITFEGLDCLVGKNNVGKTNIVSSIKYLLEQEDKTKDEELYWNKETSRTVEVRGYFNVLEKDLHRIQDERKREQVRELLLNWEDFDNHLGICRITESEEKGGNTSFQVIQLRPIDEELSEDTFLDFRDDQWGNIDDKEGFTNTDYRDAMREKYPEVAGHVDEDSLKQKGAWKDGYESYIASRPEGLEFEPKPTSFPSGTKQLIREVVLPDVVKIPAIKEVEDAAQTSGELGEMTDALYSELEEDINKQLDENLGSVYDRLDTSSEAFETQISDYLKQAFRDYSVELDFPRVESRRLFRGVDIRIEDDQLEDTLSHENVGEGVRRVLVFSMLRTIADLRDGSLSIANEDSEENEQRQPLLILYEEAELFLHPNLQKNLLRVFRSLCNGDAQIIFNTHSPLLIQNKILDTINIVRDKNGTEVTQFHTVLNQKEPREQSRLMDLQKVSSYIFSERVVLVEGRSDAIVLREVSSSLNPNWNFDSLGIPVLQVGGKTNLPLFKDFLEQLGIDVFVIADIGALRWSVSAMVKEESIEEEIEELKDTSESLVDDGKVDHTWNSSDIDSKILNATWERTFERYRELKERLEDGEEPDQEHIDSIKKLINKKSDDAWRKAITSNHERINSDRLELRARLLEENILLLNGEIEDYYPDVEVSNKTEAALEFSADNYDVSELRDHFVELPERDETDVDAFLGEVFDV
jgi:predicted ATP-dependent endonuclease of OLD family